MYEDICRERSGQTPDDYPEAIRNRIDRCLSEVLERHPQVKQVSLTGSYARGDYIDFDTSDEFIEMKKAARRKVKLSDIDFITKPCIFDFFIATNGFKVHCVRGVYPRTPIINWYNGD